MKRFLWALFLSQALWAQTPALLDSSVLNLTSYDDIQPPQDSIPTEAIKTFVDVFDAVRQHYVEPISNQALMERAIRGMLNRLDPHSSYLNPQELSAFNQESQGEYSGIGVMLDMKAGSLQIVATLEGSPAAKAGLQSGDIINQINGQNLTDLNLDETSKLLNGEVGTEVRLLVQRGTSVQTYVLTREWIQGNSVSSRMLTDEFAYLRISQFQDDTADLLVKELDILRVKYTIKGVILDLRNNPGGFLESALAVADLFLDAGAIVSVKGQQEQDVEQHQASAGDVLNGMNLVVLIDAGSASAAEIVAGALQDNRRALIVGEQSFGKGSVQTVMPLGHGGALKLTTARYFTPSGRSIQAEGIMPQVLISHLKVKNQEDSGENLRESALPYHLRSFSETLAPSQDSQGSALAEQDFMLYEALNLLMALSIFNAV